MKFDNGHFAKGRRHLKQQESFTPTLRGTKEKSFLTIISVANDHYRTFIQAVVYNYSVLKEEGDEAGVKAKGKVLTKGKDYVVEDGDILLFKFLCLSFVQDLHSITNSHTGSQQGIDGRVRRSVFIMEHAGYHVITCSRTYIGVQRIEHNPFVSNILMVLVELRASCCA